MKVTVHPDQTQRLEQLFHRAVELPAHDHAEFVARECRGDAELADELAALLRLDAIDSAIESPLQSLVVRAEGSADLAIGEQVGPYRVLRRLGEGGMGAVFLAQQEEPLVRLVAIKVVKLGMDTEGLLKRFDAERRALARMDHPNIAKVLDAGVTHGRPFLVIEFVDGRPLTKSCAERQTGDRDRLELFVQTCRGVQHAHQRGVVHRDLKPSNILVAELDGTLVPRIIDFGIAKAVVGSLTDDGQQTNHGVVGTPDYMSPEQSQPNEASIDTRSDVYALGVVLHELLTGSLPKDSAALRGDLGWIVRRATEQAPDDRYQSASELAADVQRHLDGLPVEAGPPSTRYLLGKFVRRHRAKVASAIAALLSLLLGLGMAVWQYRRAAGHLADFRSMADVRAVQDLVHEARFELWPAWPEQVPPMRAWLARARGLLARRSEHRQRLDRWKESALPDDDEMLWQIDTVRGLLAELDGLGGDQGLIREVERRIERATALERATRSSLWAQVEQATGVGPQPGLVPLGQNADTGLWELWDVGTGSQPDFDSSTGTAPPAEATGVVFVLLPGGTFTMGATPYYSQTTDGHNQDMDAGPLERPLHDITLAPFLISKFEMTQGQWLRSTGTNPSFNRPGTLRNGVPTDLRHPVEQVSWSDCTTILHRLGMTLPTEAQWEYACRAGTHTPFSTGDVIESLVGYANLADEASKEFFTIKWSPWPFDVGTDDGHVIHAPAGSYRPNAFGLFDVHGNVFEWCQDHQLSYACPVQPATALRVPTDAETTLLRVFRGGSYYQTALAARSAHRWGETPDVQQFNVGLRPARLLR